MNRDWQWRRRMIPGTFGGRSRIATPSPLPARAAAPLSTSSSGVLPCCGPNPMPYPGNPVNGHAAFVVPCDFVTDMRVEMTFISFDETNYNEWSLITRFSGGHHYKMHWRPSAGGFGPYPDYYVELLEGHPGFGDNVIDETFPSTVSAPGPGDVLELVSAGDSHVASINGTPLLSGAGINPYIGTGSMGNYQEYSPAPDEWVANLVTEAHCS